jgi:hypothetical protein
MPGRVTMESSGFDPRQGHPSTCQSGRVPLGRLWSPLLAATPECVSILRVVAVPPRERTTRRLVPIAYSFISSLQFARIAVYLGMVNQKTFVLRQVGTSSFVRKLPHNFTKDNFVNGWDDLPSRALSWDTHEQALTAKQRDHDGDALTVEEI